MEGLLISFDGLDSSGKETQTRLLKQHLEQSGHAVKQFQTPDYSTPSGKELKQRLQGVLGDWEATPWQEKMGYFAANRAEHKQEVLDALASGSIVIYDRYIPSSLAFITIEALSREDTPQRRQEIYQAVEELEYTQNGMPREDLSLFLDIPPRIADTLLLNRKKKGTQADEYTDHLDVQERLYEEYEYMSDNDPKRFGRIRCMDDSGLRSIESISAEVLEYVTSRVLR